MDIEAIVEQYICHQLDAQAAFRLLNDNHLFAEAFMRLLACSHEDQAALAGLCPKHLASTPSVQS